MENSKFFMISNEYQDAKCRIRIPGQAGQVLNVIERLTWGWKKREAEISLKTFRKMTGMNSDHIIRSRNKLLKMNLINLNNALQGSDSTLQGNKRSGRYRIQTDYTKWKAVPYRVLPQKGNKSSTLEGNKSVPCRVTPTPNNKDINVKDISINTVKPQKIKYLKLRKKELQVELKEKDQFQNKKYLIKGIKEIDKQLKKRR